MTPSLVVGITFPLCQLNVYPGWRCNLVSFIFNLSLMLSAGMFFCMALNLPLVLVYGVNGQRMEKYYILGTSVVCTACTMSAYASGSLGWNTFSQACWYRGDDPAAMLRWVIGTQTFWLLLVSAGEVIAFLTIIGYMIAYQVRPFAHAIFVFSDTFHSSLRAALRHKHSRASRPKIRTRRD
ncbi:hypothetical protein DFH09DRAFT_933990 [Mycena vulgaris]|nr:hypothetical protein DFH09DRAFT_933990 [Mycena vulgaris]